jgi:hypothetical protein
MLFAISDRPSVRTYQRHSSTVHIFVKFDKENFYEDLSSNSTFGSNQTKISGTLRDDQSTVWIVDRSKKYFVARQQCTGKPLLHSRGKNKDVYTVDRKYNLSASQQWLRWRTTMLHYTYIAWFVEKYLDNNHTLKCHKLPSVMTELHNIELAVHVPHNKSLYQQCHYMLYTLPPLYVTNLFH